MFIYFLKSMGNIYSFTLPAKVFTTFISSFLFLAFLFFWVINFGTRCSRKILTETNLSPFISPLLFFSGLLIFFFSEIFEKDQRKTNYFILFARKVGERL